MMEVLKHGGGGTENWGCSGWRGEGSVRSHINTCRERMKNRETDFSVVPNNSTRENEHKLKHVKFHWNSRINFFFFFFSPGEANQTIEQASTEVVESPSLERVLGSLFQVTMPEQGIGGEGWTR